jgi:hypothetical protein
VFGEEMDAVRRSYPHPRASPIIHGDDEELDCNATFMYSEQDRNPSVPEPNEAELESAALYNPPALFMIAFKNCEKSTLVTYLPQFAWMVTGRELAFEYCTDVILGNIYMYIGNFAVVGHYPGQVMELFTWLGRPKIKVVLPLTLEQCKILEKKLTRHFLWFELGGKWEHKVYDEDFLKITCTCISPLKNYEFYIARNPDKRRHLFNTPRNCYSLLAKLEKYQVGRNIGFVYWGNVCCFRLGEIIWHPLDFDRVKKNSVFDDTYQGRICAHEQLRFKLEDISGKTHAVFQRFLRNCNL